MKKSRLKRIIELQDVLISYLEPYYLEDEQGQKRWIEEWYDTLKVRIKELKKKK